MAKFKKGDVVYIPHSSNNKWYVAKVTLVSKAKICESTNTKTFRIYFYTDEHSVDSKLIFKTPEECWIYMTEKMDVDAEPLYDTNGKDYKGVVEVK